MPVPPLATERGKVKAACFPLKVFQSVELKYPEAVDEACKIDKVKFPFKDPPPCKGEVVFMFLVSGT